MPLCYRRVSDADRERMMERYDHGEDFLTTANELDINPLVTDPLYLVCMAKNSI